MQKTSALCVGVQQLTFLPIKPNSFATFAAQLYCNRKNANVETREKILRNIFWL
jgi:hypothetical protein